MFNMVKQFIVEFIDSLDRGIVIESEMLYEKVKLEYALCKDNYMASLSILSDYTYDFFAVEIESEDTLIVKTKKFKKLDDLLEEVKKDVLDFSLLD